MGICYHHFCIMLYWHILTHICESYPSTLNGITCYIENWLADVSKSQLVLFLNLHHNIVHWWLYLTGQHRGQSLNSTLCILNLPVNICIEQYTWFIFVISCRVKLPPSWKDQHCKAFSLEHHHLQKLLLWWVLPKGAKGRRAATKASGQAIHGIKTSVQIQWMEEWTCLRWGQKFFHDWSRVNLWRFQNLVLQMSSEKSSLHAMKYWLEKKTNKTPDFMIHKTYGSDFVPQALT